MIKIIKYTGNFYFFILKILIFFDGDEHPQDEFPVVKDLLINVNVKFEILEQAGK